MSSPQLNPLSPQQFIAWEAQQDERYEYVDGEVQAMTGGTYAHDRVRANLGAALLAHLRGTGCRAIGPELRLRVDASTPGFYPDLFVVCREIDRRAAELDEAKVIIEVLSPSTEKKDRGTKWIEYQKLAMLQEYVLIDPDKRRVEIFRRIGATDWRLHICSPADPVRIDSLGFEATFQTVFEDLE